MSLDISSISAAHSPSADGAGQPFAPSGRPAPTCWVEAYVARRNAARDHLGSRGMMPQRAGGEFTSELSRWRVPGWTGLLDDDDMMALARQHGWSDSNG